MKINPLLAEFQSYAGLPGSIFLESSFEEKNHGRYSLMAVHPFLILTAKGETIHVLTATGEEIFKGDALSVLQEILIENRDSPRKWGQSLFSPSISPYGPGALGYFSYELGYALQGIPCLPKDDLNLPDLWFAFYDEIVIYDHFEGKRMRIAGPPQKKIPLQPKNGDSPRNWGQSPFLFEDYRRGFETAMENIRAGNIYQVNLCQRFSAALTENPWDTYLKMRAEHPTSYGAYLNTGQNTILSASPELFLGKRGNQIETRPIKGTCLKAESPEQESNTQRNLKESAKEQAEHIMIVDLERNDLGRICKTGSIAAENLFEIEGCGEVDHLVSTVRGELRNGIQLRDILTATFPGGSVTGAPKRKAMEIIGRLEPVVRGVYTGALGWIGFSGDFTFNLPIRTILIQDQAAHLYLGGGVVADSKCDLEYQEILNKGLPFFKLLGVTPHAPSLA